MPRTSVHTFRAAAAFEGCLIAVSPRSRSKNDKQLQRQLTAAHLSQISSRFCSASAEFLQSLPDTKADPEDQNANEAAILSDFTLSRPSTMESQGSASHSRISSALPSRAQTPPDVHAAAKALIGLQNRYQVWPMCIFKPLLKTRLFCLGGSKEFLLGLFLKLLA